MKEYAIEQRRFNEKFFGRGTRNIDSVEGLLNKYAQEGWSLHTMMTTPTRDEKTQLTTMVFVRERPYIFLFQIFEKTMLQYKKRGCRKL